MKINIIANFIGRFWSVISGFIFIPLYIKYLGFESYSIISFTLVLSGVMAVLDSGLTATLSREFAKQNTGRIEKKRIFDKLEIFYLFIGATIILGVYFLAGIIADKFIDSSLYTQDQVIFFLRIIGIDIACQMITRFYIGGLLGLEKQVQANFIQIGWGVLRNAAVIIVLLLSPTLNSFFIWQASVSFLFVLIARIRLLNQIGAIQNVNYSNRIGGYKDVWRFASGMLLISIVASINTQVDKLMLSNLLSIESLGYYTIAVSLSLGLLSVISPFTIAVLPKFTAYYSENKINDASALLLKIHGIIGIIVFAFMANMIFFANDIIWVWTGDMTIADESGKYLPILAFSYAMLSIQTLFYNIAIANGYTLLNNILGIASLLITIPGYYFGIKLYEVWGATFVFFIVQTLITFIYLYLINKRFLKGISFYTLIITKLLLPCIVALFIAYLFSLIVLKDNTRLIAFLRVGSSTIVTFLITTVFFTPKVDLIKLVKFKIN
jgi:O-antigen/teichoic acid export membrane protein